MLDDLIASIEESALDSKLWFSLQEKLELFFGAASSQMVRCDHSCGNSFWTRTTKFPEVDGKFLDIGPKCEPALYCAANPNWKIFSDYDFIDEADIDKSDFYDFNRMFGMRYRLGVRLLNTPGVSEGIVMTWPRKCGHVQQEHYEKVHLIHDRLCLSAKVASQLGQPKIEEKGLLDGLGIAQAPALITDADSRILMANLPAERILTKEDGIFSLQGILVAAAPAAQKQLRHAIAAAARNMATIKNATVIVPCPSGHRPLGITICSLPGRHQLFGPMRRLVLLLLRDGSQQARPKSEVLTQAFGLTPAEAEIATLFAAGADSVEIAERRRTTVGSARQQLKMLMTKLEVRRQTDLLRILWAYSD